VRAAPAVAFAGAVASPGELQFANEGGVSLDDADRHVARVATVEWKLEKVAAKARATREVLPLMAEIAAQLQQLHVEDTHPLPQEADMYNSGRGTASGTAGQGDDLD
jgi:hypothetical protein